MLPLRPLLLALLAVPAIAMASAPDSEQAPHATPDAAISFEALRAQGVQPMFNIPYAGTGHPRHRLDLYLPDQRTTVDLPVIVFLHDGQWSGGDKAEATSRLMPFVRGGDYAGVAVGYRLTPEAQWPDQIEDAKAAIRWIRANGQRYGLDTSRIGVWGVGTGAHLALMLGVTPDNEQFEGSFGRRNFTSRVQAVVNFSGVTDIPALLNQFTELDRRSPDAPEARLLGTPIAQNLDAARNASPITWVSAESAPTLHEAGVQSILVPVEGAGHGDFGDAADARVRAFLDRHLHLRPVMVPSDSIRMREH